MPSTPLQTDERYMCEALSLARQSPVLPYPNPWVGCVIVRNGKVVGRGFHRGAGNPHAEVEALKQAGAHARNATLYVNLEPCCHFGRTPPCTDAILQSGIRRVVYAVRDPNPVIQSRGAAILKKRGLEVVSGMCAAEAAALNEVYLKFRATGLPFVTAKVATSLDGKIATRTGVSKWITDQAARRRARQIRREHQAVLVGVNTILTDNPHLGLRPPGPVEPWRIVLDSRLRIPLRAQVLKSGRCIVATTASLASRKAQQLIRAGAQVWRLQGKRIPIKRLLKKLADAGILSVMVEGGSEVLGSFYDLRLIDRIYWFFAPMIIGSEQSRSAFRGKGVSRLERAARLRNFRIEPVGNGWMIRGNMSRWALDQADNENTL
ncbi:MAG TPA: bifunctional diaminohydroxyphosphoribosylaminopyrimidine deaminase/5-amino-6-(5-phosphoribosylamino)uracil reductase RibD [Terriglobia bacterium]|nr:bifunctional diaminohydroxyphosphoribosylaminopyrimidine deaminase/5-amino-6-(5-phosphoribosylamino)uracil reductase RibD [Terriglobia bacterium]